ncbi:MAG: PAS domain-containing protein, partial [Flavobacterium sp.]|nr:PAS domain-containing protein [Flavobacterium sp.]
MSQPKIAEDIKNKSNDLFFDMFENSDIGKIFIDTKTTQFQYVNKSFLTCFGYTMSEIMGKSAIELGIINSDFQQKMTQEIKNHDETNTIEIILKNKTGMPFWFLVSVQPMKYQGNDCSLISFIDITKQKKTTAELVIANKELAFQNEEKEKRAAELVIANIELEHQNSEKEKRADELLIANIELEHQNKIKEKRADELVIANKELEFQTGEKQNRADELVIADKELNFQNEEKEKRVFENKELEAYNYSLKLASHYSLSLIEASRDPL